MTNQLQDPDWDTLVLSIVQGDCILMLGPDAVTAEKDGARHPILRLFASHLISKIPPEVAESLADATLADAAQVYRRERRVGANDLLNEAQRFFGPRKDPVDPVLANLAALPFKLIVNTTPGFEMEKALLEANKPCHTGIYSAKGRKVDMTEEGTVERPLVYYLYGSVKDLKSLVLTDNDLLDFLVAVVSEYPALPNNIKSAFAQRDHCFLFLGFGFRHWYLRILLHVLYKGRAENRSFALERFDDNLGRTAIHTTKLFFQEGHKIDFFDMDLIEFSRELRKRVEAQLKAPEEEASAAREKNQPHVFICHASEDKDYAKALFDRLQAKALRPWIDVDGLRGGIRWDDEIRRIIKDEVDYVVILQSQALASKMEGYVNREINIALDRQETFRRPLSFVIPVLIDGSGKLAEVKHLQSIDLTGERGFDELVSTIKRDQQLRLKGA